MLDTTKTVMTPKFMSPVLTSPLNSGLYPAAYLTFPLRYTAQNLCWLFLCVSTASGLIRTSDLLPPISFSLLCLSHFSKCLYCPLGSDKIKNLILLFLFYSSCTCRSFCLQNIFRNHLYILGYNHGTNQQSSLS